MKSAILFLSICALSLGMSPSSKADYFPVAPALSGSATSGGVLMGSIIASATGTNIVVGATIGASAGAGVALVILGGLALTGYISAMATLEGSHSWDLQAIQTDAAARLRGEDASPLLQEAGELLKADAARQGIALSEEEIDQLLLHAQAN